MAAPFLEENADGELCGLLGILDGPEDFERAAREDHADGRLAIPRARHAAQLALRVGAAADQRRVADAPRELARPAPGGRARDNGAEAVDGDSADGARLERLEPLSLPRGHELAGIAERDAEGARLVDRSRADEEGVAPVVEDAPGEGDRVPNLRDTGHGPVAERVALHDGRVHLDGARGREDGAAPGIEARVILEHAHRRFHRVERAATAAENLPAGLDGARDALAELFGLLGRVRPRAAVDDEGRHAACHPLHLALTMTA